MLPHFQRETVQRGRLALERPSVQWSGGGLLWSLVAQLWTNRDTIFRCSGAAGGGCGCAAVTSHKRA